MKQLATNNYGFIGDFKELLIEQLETLSSIKPDLHDSLYWGDYWLYRCNNGGELKLYFNIDPMYDPGDDPSELYFDFTNKDCDILLCVKSEPLWVQAINDSIINIENIRFIKSKMYKYE